MIERAHEQADLEVERTPAVDGILHRHGQLASCATLSAARSPSPHHVTLPGAKETAR